MNHQTFPSEPLGRSLPTASTLTFVIALAVIGVFFLVPGMSDRYFSPEIAPTSESAKTSPQAETCHVKRFSEDANLYKSTCAVELPTGQYDAIKLVLMVPAVRAWWQNYSLPSWAEHNGIMEVEEFDNEHLEDPYFRVLFSDSSLSTQLCAGLEYFVYKKTGEIRELTCSEF